MPFDIAFSLEEVERAAWGIIFSEFRGNTFDLQRMEFERHD
ncbi:hypothetical protein [Paludibacterium paludis]|uniref:Uncharacterized protein n=1 Tax=Paludibacterium paludis TaxID=1225769 RepID=A0A918NYN2_9NEIS|nr:hypothetical protein [Paludibacterium paludis]GGY07098.1 hypothetical protein GCM10011289_07130 [Paludibacterium paludis]